MIIPCSPPWSGNGCPEYEQCRSQLCNSRVTGMVKECFTAQLVQSRDASLPSWYDQGLMGIAEVTEHLQWEAEGVGNAPPQPTP